jgi:hypothetical protein
MELTVGALYSPAFGKQHKTLSALRCFDDTGESIGMYPSPNRETPPQKILACCDPDADESQQAMSWFTCLSNCFALGPSGKLVELGRD